MLRFSIRTRSPIGSHSYYVAAARQRQLTNWEPAGTARFAVRSHGAGILSTSAGYSHVLGVRFRTEKRESEHPGPLASVQNALIELTFQQLASCGVAIGVHPSDPP